MSSGDVISAGRQYRQFTGYRDYAKLKRLDEKLVGKLTELVKKDRIILITVPNCYGSYELFDELPMRLLVKAYHNFSGRHDATASPYVQKHNFTFKAFTTLLNAMAYLSKRWDMHISCFSGLY